MQLKYLLKKIRPYVVVAASLFILVLIFRIYPHTPLKKTVVTSTAIYAKNGELMRLALASDEQYRLWVSLEHIDSRLTEAVQLYEDRWFYWHIGINPIAMVLSLIHI